MFTPNQVGIIYRAGLTRDVYGKQIFDPGVECAFAPVNAKRQSEKTSVRADSSASRGASDEITTALGRILIPPYERVEIGDLFEFDGDKYEIRSKHIRRSVVGEIDHFECDLRVMPR